MKMISADTVNFPLIDVRLSKIGNDLINVRSTVVALIAAADSSREISKSEMADVLEVAERLLSELCEAADSTSLLREAASEEEEREIHRLLKAGL
jgi:hypothetical protein